jgi:hypothetical protein
LLPFRRHASPTQTSNTAVPQRTHHCNQSRRERASATAEITALNGKLSSSGSRLCINPVPYNVASTKSWPSVRSGDSALERRVSSQIGSERRVLSFSVSASDELLLRLSYSKIIRLGGDIFLPSEGPPGLWRASYSVTTNQLFLYPWLGRRNSSHRN